MTEAVIGRFEATPEMVEVHTNAQNLVHDTFRSLVLQALKVHAAMNVKLTGGIQHGARRHLYHQYDAMFFAAQSLKDVLPDEQGRDWFPWMVLRNHHARSGMSLPGWMQRLIDKNDGPPETWSNDDVMSDEAIYSEYVEAVKRHGPYNVLTFDSWKSAPKPILHEKLGVIKP
jgi:hypothetical protein